MNFLPDLKFPEHSKALTLSEQALIDKLNNDYKSHFTQVLADLNKSLASSEGPTSQKETKFSLEIPNHLLSTYLSQALSLKRTKKELDTIQEIISTTEKLLFLIRFFNWDNDEEFTKSLASFSKKAQSVIYAFNVSFQNWVESVARHIEPNINVLTQLVQRLEEKALEHIPIDLLGIRVPIKVKRVPNTISRVILLDYYYLERAYRILQESFVSKIEEEVQAKIKTMCYRLTNGQASDIEMKGERNLQKSSENIALSELGSEFERMKSHKGYDQVLETLYHPKKRLDDLNSQAQLEIEAHKNKQTNVSDLQVSQNKSELSNQGEENFLALEKADEILSGEVQDYLTSGKSLKNYWQEVAEEVRQEVVRMISMDKFALQAAYLPLYFEEKFVSFHSSSGQFIHENFARLIEDFCSNSSKEYKNMPPTANNQGLHSLYYCYIAENVQDFYLVEYNPTMPILKVYLTAAPMLATLHKHLAKLDITKISKKSFSITRLNFYDTNVGIELRNLFLEQKNKKDSYEEDQDSIAQQFKYFVFITIFLLNNSPVQTNAPEISFNLQHLMTFYNYLADFQSVSIKNQEENQPIPSTFEFYYPFIDKRQPQNLYLIYNKKDPSREMGLTSVRNMCYQNKDFLKYGELLSEEKFHTETFFNNEILRYLKRNETKSSFNFDGHTYLIEYLKRLAKRPVSGSPSFENSIRVIPKTQTQVIFEAFQARNGDIKEIRGLENISTARKVYFLFSGVAEQLGVLMISYERKTDNVILYLWDINEAIEFEALEAFVDFILEIMKTGKEHIEEEVKEEERQIYYTICKTKDEIVIQYFMNHYFPYTYLFEQESKGLKEMLDIKLEDLIEPFKSFLALNVSENNLDVFKAYSKILEEKMFKQWEIVNVGTMNKFADLKSTIQTLAEKLVEEQVPHVLLSFSFLGAIGSKVYYLYLQAMPTEDKEETKVDSKSQEISYLVDLYSLVFNLDIDNNEILAILYHCCKTIPKPRFVFNAAYRINPRNNILLYTQVDISLTTLGYLVHFCNLSMERAFQKISRSIVSHYEILEALMSQTDMSGENDKVVEADTTESQADSQPKLTEPLITSHREMTQRLKTKVFESFFEDLPQENRLKKKLEEEIPILLKEVALEDTINAESMDIASFLNVLNCEVAQESTYFFATNEMFTKRVLTNENKILSDKSVYSFLIKEIASAKEKYEEALEIKYHNTVIYFITPMGLIHEQGVPLLSYHFESHQVTFYQLHSSQKPELTENIIKFVNTLNLRLTVENMQSASKELDIKTCKVVITDQIYKVIENQYRLIIKALIRLSSRQAAQTEEKIILNTERLNEFMCEYADDLLAQGLEDSKVKAHYKYLSNLFLQEGSPITKKIALLTFLNGIASIDQLNVIKDCIKSFRDDFQKILDIEHAFFCFNVSVKESIKHYFIHLTGEDRGDLTLKIFTNVLGDTDGIIDRMIQSYCLEEEEDDIQAEEENLNIAKLLLFKINIPNIVFARHLEISSLLIAHTVCNDLGSSNEYCAELALSPLHYFNELKTFEKKCEDLGLFRELSSETSLGAIS